MSERPRSIATREAFGQALAELGERHPEVVVLDADLSGSTKSAMFGKRFPDRFFQMGVAETNMVGVAAGLALSGKTAFCCSFAYFVTSRFDAIRLSVVSNVANVKIVGSHSGVGVGEDGFSHMALEDMALMRSLPGISILHPADDIETARVVEHLCQSRGPAYQRLTRQAAVRVHTDGYRFQPGKLDLLREGKDVAILAAGPVVGQALLAADTLAGRRIDAAVLGVPTVKPLDELAVEQWAARVPLIVTVEDHNIIGGLGSAVAEAVARSGGARVSRHGIRDLKAESGAWSALYRLYRLDAAGIAEVVEEQLQLSR
jgi:transketolase